jgi:hypothetical protein
MCKTGAEASLRSQMRVIALREKRSSARTSHVAARRQIGARSSRNP